MSVQFGRWSFGGQPAAPGYLEKAVELLAPYGPDGGGRYAGPGVDIIYRSFHTTRESRREQQPQQLASGAVLTWDGRLDNREELLRQLGPKVTLELPDAEIAVAAYAQWGTKSFARLIGDWALSIWNPRDHELILAKDFLGTRHLYYAPNKDAVTWSTILDPLVLLAGRTFQLEEEYIAGWLAFFPAAHLTPYVGIHAVPPSTFVSLHAGKEKVTKYWDFDPHRQIRYSSDREYEEHFRTVFRESVRRRLRSDAPVLAELSGGMDSSSIVCMAHTIIVRGCTDHPRLDTLSYYNDSEPNWNERPYFERVEEKLGRFGCRIDVSDRKSFELGSAGDHFAATPGSCTRRDEIARQFAICLESQGNRAVLSGIGGDEVTGGVPTPTPELMDALGRARFHALAHGLKVWALNKREPWFHLLIEAARGFLPPNLVGVCTQRRPAYWLSPSFIARHQDALSGYPSRVRLLGALPAFQENISTLEALRRQMASHALPSTPPHEKRYPYLDRDLLRFLYAVPREQLVRPGERRSLMRRALRSIVPAEILDRKRKAYVARSPVMTVLNEWTNLIEKRPQLLSSLLGFVDSEELGKALQKTRGGQEVSIVSVMRTLQIESWLRTITGRVLALPHESEINDAAGLPRRQVLSRSFR